MEKFCQSCAMPMTDELYGEEQDGSTSKDYCKYCYEKGAFTADVTMDEMVEICVPHMQGMDTDDARKLMRQSLPMLKRWQAN